MKSANRAPEMNPKRPRTAPRLTTPPQLIAHYPFILLCLFETRAAMTIRPARRPRRPNPGRCVGTTTHRDDFPESSGRRLFPNRRPAASEGGVDCRLARHDGLAEGTVFWKGGVVVVCGVGVVVTGGVVAVCGGLPGGTPFW